MRKCPLCKKSASKYHKIDGFQYYRCPNCKTVFLHPKPTEKETDEYYRKSYEYGPTFANSEHLHEKSKYIIRRLKKLNPNGNTLLDIGSGLGIFLEEAANFGLMPIGIEPSRSLKKLMAKNKFKVFWETFDEFAKHNRNKFDFIVFSHVVEHLSEPQKIVNNILRLLNENGILYIETPNADSRLFYAEGKNHVFLTPPAHIWLFSLESFRLFKYSNSRKFITLLAHTLSRPEHFMGIVKSLLGTNKAIAPPTAGGDTDVNPNVVAGKGTIKNLKYLFFDRFLAPLLTPLLNFRSKGSIISLYIKRID